VVALIVRPSALRYKSQPCLCGIISLCLRPSRPLQLLDERNEPNELRDRANRDSIAFKSGRAMRPRKSAHPLVSILLERDIQRGGSAQPRGDPRPSPSRPLWISSVDQLASGDVRILTLRHPIGLQSLESHGRLYGLLISSYNGS
jgi:hypothetical protein